MKSFLKAIVWVLVAALLVCGIVLVWRYINGEPLSSLTSFTLDMDGEEIEAGRSSLELRPGKKYIFSLKDGLTRNPLAEDKFTAAVVPNPDFDFEYTVDGDSVVWKNAGNLSGLFALTKDGGSFSLTIPAEFKLSTALGELIYRNESLSFPLDFDETKDYYLLRVAGTSGEAVYEIALSIKGDEHRISYVFLNSEPGMTWTPEIPSFASEGERIEFNIPYPVTVTMKYGESADVISPDIRFMYTFVMPGSDVLIEIDFARG